MALAVNGVTASPYVDTAYANNGNGKTTITPFSDILKKEQQAAASVSTAQKAQTPQAASSSGAASPSGAVSSSTGIASTNGTTGKMSSDGKLTTKLDDIFRRASEKYDISYDFLIAVAKAESDFNPNCVSSAGAKGIMQVMPYEAKELGITDVFDPEQNIMGAAKLLAAHLKKFDGDTTLAAAAYNAGSGRVKQYGGVPPFKETQNYVKKIAAYMKEGVNVPDKTYTVSPNKLSGDVTKSQGKQGQGTQNQVPGAVAATEEELNQSMVVVGSGEQAVTMTYGAYLRYLELGSLGVG